MRRVAQGSRLCRLDDEGRRVAGALSTPPPISIRANSPAPEAFRPDRENKVHLAFGAGVHRCLGAHLARVELQVLYQQVLKRLPEFRLDPDKPATFHSGNIIAFDSLPIRWD